MSQPTPVFRVPAVCAGLVLLLHAAASSAQQPEPGYLYPRETLHIEAWLPPAPARDSLAQAADVEAVQHDRALLGTPRADEAHADDVVKPAEQVAARFTYLFGVRLDRGNAPHFLHMMDLVRNDIEWLLTPVKKEVGAGGRQRPFVAYPHLATCPMTNAKLGETGSYPSGHSTTGWAWGSILAELVPEFADQLIARAIAFGDSRVVCGFHYPSDVTGGRLAAAALLDRLHGDPAFMRDLAAARKELATLVARSAGKR
jgi:acid phosphatase (class A)